MDFYTLDTPPVGGLLLGGSWCVELPQSTGRLVHMTEEWMTIGEFAEECRVDVYALREALERLGLFEVGEPTALAVRHALATSGVEDGGRSVSLWHADSVVLAKAVLSEESSASLGFSSSLRTETEGVQGDLFDVVYADEAIDADAQDGTDGEIDADAQDGTDAGNDVDAKTGADVHTDGVGNAIGTSGCAWEIDDSSGRGNTRRKERKAGGEQKRRAESIGKIVPGFDAIIATDGACLGNPGPGGWAWVEQITGERGSGGALQTTNNAMELTALVHALEHVGPEADVLMRIDSQYVINAMTRWAKTWRRKGWRKSDGNPVANRELVERLLELYEGREGRTEVEWVKGHSGDAANELVDSLASAEAARRRK